MLLKSSGSAFDIDATAPEAPTPPESLKEAGLTLAFLNDLILKALYLRGTMLGRDLGQFLCLPFKVVKEALKFLLHFNQHQFNLQIRARDYYGFFSLTVLACGIVFQLPVFILGLVRMGITTPAKLRKNRRYAILVCAIVAAALPGVDPVSMLLEMVPLVALYELSILLASAFGGRKSSEVGDPLASAEGS